MVDDNDYEEGFRQGMRAIKGARAYIGHIPYMGHIPYGKTAFQLGLARGIEKAKGWSNGALFNATDIT